MPNPKDELPESVINLMKDKGFYDKLIKRAPNEVPTIRAMTRWGHKEPEYPKWKHLEWDYGPSFPWQQVWSWIPDIEQDAITVWEGEGGYVR